MASQQALLQAHVGIAHLAEDPVCTSTHPLASVRHFRFLVHSTPSEPASLAPVDGHGGSFQFGAVTDTAAMNVCNSPCVFMSFLFSWVNT